MKRRAHHSRFSSRNAVRPVPQARPGGIRDSLRREASQAAGAAPTLRYGPAGDSAPRLRLKAAGMTERFPFGPASTARKSTPRCPFGRIAIYGYRTLSNEIQNHWLICIPPFPHAQPRKNALFMVVLPWRRRAAPRAGKPGIEGRMVGSAPRGAAPLRQETGCVTLQNCRMDPHRKSQPDGYKETR